MRASSTMTPTDYREIEQRAQTRLDFIYAVSEAMNFLEYSIACSSGRRSTARSTSADEQRRRREGRRARRKRARRCCASSSGGASASSATPSKPLLSMSTPAPLRFGEELGLRFDALPPLSLYVASAVVRAQVPVLRLQFLRSARRAAGSRVRRRAAARLAQRVAVRARPADRDDFLRRRHAEPVLGRGDRALARRAASRGCRSPPVAEITLEANPGAVDAARFAAFREAGVNRLSIGIQSFRNEQLRALGRVHDAAEARSGRRDGARRGFDNLNLDLMYGLAGRRRRGRPRGSRASHRARSPRTSLGTS